MFLHPLGLLALLGVPSVVALHLFRRRFQPRVVSALFLWEVRDATSLAGRRRERLRSSASFWLELALALCLGLAFASPRGCAADESVHLVGVLDSSASMTARAPSGESFAERARAELLDAIAQLPSGSRVSLLESGPHPRLLAGPAAFPAEAEEALERWRPRHARHDLGPALDLALELGGGARVFLWTDRDLSDSVGAEVELRAVGAPLENVGVVHASRTPGENAAGEPVERVFLTVQNASERPAARELVLELGGAPFAQQRLEFAPEARRHLSFELERGAPSLVVHLEPDALQLDDQAYLAPLAPRTVALAAELGADELRLLGLSQAPGDIERWLQLVPESVAAAPPSLAHLALGDGTRAVDERRWELALVAEGSERSDLIGPFLGDKRHPLLAGLTLEGIVWSIEPGRALPGAPLVSAGNTPILSEERTNGGRRYHLNLDPARSSLQRSPDWPILLANLAEMRRRALPGPDRSNLALGEALTVRGLRGSEALVLRGPEGEEELAPAQTLVIEQLELPGEYELLADDQLLARFGVSLLDGAESDLRELSQLVRASDAKSAALEAGASGWQLVLLGLALACWAADWFVLRARKREAA